MTEKSKNFLVVPLKKVYYNEKKSSQLYIGRGKMGEIPHEVL